MKRKYEFKMRLMSVVMLLFFFSPALLPQEDQPGAGGTPQTTVVKPDKIWYLKEGNVQYFYFKEADKLCYFRLEALEKNLALEFNFQKSADAEVRLRKQGDIFILEPGNKKCSNVEEALMVLEEELKKIAGKDNMEKFLVSWKVDLDSNKIDMKTIKINQEGLNELEELVRHFDFLRKENDLSFSPVNFREKYKEIDNLFNQGKNGENQDFQYWQGKLAVYQLEDFRMSLLSKDIESLAPGSLLSVYIFPTAKIVFPLLVILLGLFWGYRKITEITDNNRKAIEDIEKRLDFPTSLEQIPVYIDYLAGQIEKDGGKNANDRSYKDVKNQLNSLKEKLEKFLELEKNPYNISISEINHSVDDIEKFTTKALQNGDYRLNEEFKKIFDFVLRKVQEKTVELRNHCQLIGKIDFIEDRSFKPGGIADALLLIKRTLTQVNDHMERALLSENFSSPAAQKEKQNYTFSSKQLIEKFYEDCDPIAIMDNSFEEQIGLLKEAFNSLQAGFNKLLGENSLINKTQAVQNVLTPGLTKLEQSLKYLEENHSEFGRIFQAFKEISGNLNDCKTELGKELEKARGTATQMANDIINQNNSGNELIKDFKEQVTLLGQNLDQLNPFPQQFEKATNILNMQNKELETKVSNFDTPLGMLNNKIELLQKQLELLEKTKSELNRTALDLSANGKIIGKNIITFSNLKDGLETSANQINMSTTTLSAELTTFHGHNRTFEGKIGELEQQRTQWLPVLTDIRKEIDTLKDEIGHLNIETDRLTKGNDESSQVINSLGDIRQSLEGEAAKINLLIDFLRNKTEDAKAFLEDLKGKTLEIGGDVARIRTIHGEIKSQTGKGKEIIKEVEKTISKLNLQVQTADKVSSQLAKQGAANEISSENIMQTSHGLSEQMEKMQGVLKDIEALKQEIDHVEETAKSLDDTAGRFGNYEKGIEALKQEIDHVEATAKTLAETAGHFENYEKEIDTLKQEVDHVEGTAKTLADTSARFENYEKEFLDHVASINPEIKLARDIFNNELKLNLTEKNSFAILRKLQGEIIESIEYRNYAINLLKDFRLVEKNHTEQWYWKLLKPVRDGLEDHKEALFRHKGQTIYDGIYNYNANTPENAPITKDHLKIVINEQHWGQIWEPLVKACQFFEVYFQDEYLEVLQLLGMSAKKIVNLLEKHLNYRIDRYLPLQQVPTQKIEAGEVQEALNHFMFYQDILPHLRNNQRFIDAGNRYAPNGQDPVIAFVDTLGLVDNGKRIRTPKVVLYSPVAIKNSR